MLNRFLLFIKLFFTDFVVAFFEKLDGELLTYMFVYAHRATTFIYLIMLRQLPLNLVFANLFYYFLNRRTLILLAFCSHFFLKGFLFFQSLQLAFKANLLVDWFEHTDLISLHLGLPTSFDILRFILVDLPFQIISILAYFLLCHFCQVWTI